MYKNKKDYIGTMTTLAKILYVLGALKIIKVRERFDKRIDYDVKLRIIHPFNWIVIPIGMVIYGLNQETFKEAKNMITFI